MKYLFPLVSLIHYLHENAPFSELVPSPLINIKLSLWTSAFCNTAYASCSQTMPSFSFLPTPLPSHVISPTSWWPSPSITLSTLSHSSPSHDICSTFSASWNHAVCGDRVVTELKVHWEHGWLWDGRNSRELDKLRVTVIRRNNGEAQTNGGLLVVHHLHDLM